MGCWGQHQQNWVCRAQQEHVLAYFCTTGNPKYQTILQYTELKLNCIIIVNSSYCTCMPYSNSSYIICRHIHTMKAHAYATWRHSELRVTDDRGMCISFFYLSEWLKTRTDSRFNIRGKFSVIWYKFWWPAAWMSYSMHLVEFSTIYAVPICYIFSGQDL